MLPLQRRNVCTFQTFFPIFSNQLHSFVVLNNNQAFVNFNTVFNTNSETALFIL